MYNVWIRYYGTCIVLKKYLYVNCINYFLVKFQNLTINILTNRFYEPIKIFIIVKIIVK